MKVNLHIKLSGEDNLDLKIKAIKGDNFYKYKENDIKVTVTKKDHQLLIERDCNDYNIMLFFENKKVLTSTYSIFGGTKKFELETKTNKLEINDKSILLEYELEGNKFIYILEELWFIIYLII